MVKRGGKVEERWRKLYLGGGKWRQHVEGDMEEKVETFGGKVLLF